MGKSLCVQVTAYSVITADGQTGTLPTGVNFEIGSGSPPSGPSSPSLSAVSALDPGCGYSSCLLGQALGGPCHAVQKAP